MQRGDRLITDKKITAADYTDKDVASAPDRLTGTAQENKAIFDRAVKEVVQPKYNALIDELDTELSSRIVSDDILKMRLDEDGVVEYSADGTDYVKMIGRHGVKGDGTPATGAEIFNHPDNVASAPYSHAEGGGCDAIGSFSHAEGNSTTASGVNSHAEGNSTRANGECSHAEGRSAQSYGKAAHAEGWFTTASGDYSHAEGVFSTASGESAHAQGHETVASGNCSYAGGYGTIASADNQFVMGKYNMGDANAAVIIGNGTDYKAPSNAMTLDWDGNLKLKGDVTFAATRSLASELDELHAYEVPVAGDELGGVKNGGNVIVNPDGTMTAPDVGAMLNRADFTQTDARWSALTDGRYTLTLSLEDQNPICVFRKDGDRYKLAVCDIESLNGTVSVISYDKFAGYLLTAEDGEGGSSSGSSVVRSINGVFPNVTDPDDVTVLFSKESHGSHFFSSVNICFNCLDGDSFPDFLINLLFNRTQFFRTHCLEMSEVKTEEFDFIKRSFLGCMTSEDIVKRCMEQVSRRVVLHHTKTTIGVDAKCVFLVQGKRSMDFNSMKWLAIWCFLNICYSSHNVS